MMDDQERHEIGRILREAIEQQRGYADFFDWPNKETKESFLAALLLGGLNRDRGESFSQIRSRPAGEDPPDCEAYDGAGRCIGIEVTELVDQAVIEENLRYKKDRSKENLKTPRIDWASWKPEEFLSKIETIMEKKGAGTVKGGPYDRYFLLIHTDEPELNIEMVREYLDGKFFHRTPLISHAFVLVSYDPRLEECPYVELQFKQNAPSS